MIDEGSNEGLRGGKVETNDLFLSEIGFCKKSLTVPVLDDPG